MPYDRRPLDKLGTEPLDKLGTEPLDKLGTEPLDKLGMGWGPPLRIVLGRSPPHLRAGTPS
jgi:hypothetical protein